MASEHQFGGSWTEKKLDSIRKYLHAYGQIFAGNVKASWYRTIYVDAFAGTGYRTTPKRHRAAANPLFNDEDAISFQKGSAIAALEVEPSFDQYVFVELSENYGKELEKLRLNFPGKASKIHVVQKEANAFLQSWCTATSWNNTRAVVFLDPYGMQVHWMTIESMAKTQGIDLWILFPLGQAVNRLLTRNRIPGGAWADRLTAFFGTDEWRSAFYRPKRQLTFFGPSDNFEKMADFASIGKFFVDRLETVFAKVARNPKPLYNTRNVPIFLLCFAAANPKGGSTAVKIAQNILEK
jgi:three-Cys-motif partner protein